MEREANLFLRTVIVSAAVVLLFSDTPIMCLKVGYVIRGGATRGLGGTVSPTPQKVNFVNRLKPTRKFWGMRGGDVTNHI